MKLNVQVATFVLAFATVAVKAGPFTKLPNTETVIGPLVAPNGTITINGKLNGSTVSDRLTINSNALLDEP